MKTAIGFDIGGTKTEVAVVRFTQNNAEVIYRHRELTQRELGYDHILALLEQLYHHALKQTKTEPVGVGFGLPGTIDPVTFRMINGNTSAFVGHDLKEDFSRITKNKPMICANDANCFALAESKFGIGQLYEKQFGTNTDSQTMLGVILGTGCGTGIVSCGQLLLGRHGGAGEFGHTLLKSDGWSCFCGRQGCAEMYVSGSGLEKNYFELTREQNTGNEIFKLAQSNETQAKLVVENYIDDLASFLSNITNAIDPHYFVLGGGVSLQKQIYTDLESRVSKKLFLPLESPKIYQNVLGDSAGVIGAAWLSIQKL